jgi:hypothetical protein
MEREIIYETHPVSPERKAELVAAGYRIVDALYGPTPEPKPVQKAELAVGKGPGGRFFIKDGKVIHSGPFHSEQEATDAMDRLA